jgi:hypothetical protein
MMAIFINGETWKRYRLEGSGFWVQRLRVMRLRILEFGERLGGEFHDF